MNENTENVNRIKRGDESSFRYFVDTYSDDLFYYAQCFVHSREIAEEVVSDIFLDVWRYREKIGEIRNMKAWLLTLTHHKAISYLRKEGDSGLVVPYDEMERFQIPSDLQTPDDQIISAEEMAKINQIIQTLPPKCKIVFVLAKIERLPYKEISEMLSISIKTINIHIAKALELISSALKK